MKILTIIANPNPKSFCHAILKQFNEGLEEAGHTNEVVDLYAIRFDPVFRTQDFASYVHESMPLDILNEMNLKQRVLELSGRSAPTDGRLVLAAGQGSPGGSEVHPPAQAQGCQRPMGEGEECPGTGVHCAGLLVSLSRDHEGLVRTGFLLRGCLRSD